jgi:hypothetical protein
MTGIWNPRQIGFDPVILPAAGATLGEQRRLVPSGLTWVNFAPIRQG